MRSFAKLLERIAWFLYRRRVNRHSRKLSDRQAAAFRAQMEAHGLWDDDESRDELTAKKQTAG